jgi:hypothetical protein
MPVDKPRSTPPQPEEFGLIHSDDDDLPVRKKRKGVSRTRRTVGLILLLLLLVTFVLVMRHRILHPQIRYVKNREDALYESLAAAHPRTGTRRPRSTKRTSVAERKKAVDACNAIEDANAEAFQCWNGAVRGLPSGTITPGVAADAAATFDDRFAQLDAADKAIDELARQAETIKAASRAPGRDGLSLSSLYAATLNLEAALRSLSKTHRDELRMEQQFYEGASRRDPGDWASAQDAIRGCRRRIEEQRGNCDRAVEALRDAADRVFD